MPLVPNYAPTDWVDHVTPVDEAHMDKIDQAIDVQADAINVLDTRLAAREAMPAIPAVVNGKWIKGVGGAAVWSDIAITDVASLQTTLNGKENTSAKGAASGYAPLDASSKVPAVNLPTPMDLRYAGTYAGATAYKEGDVVIYNGVSYMALRSTTGETPTPWGTGGGGATAVGGWDTVAVLATQQDSTGTGVMDVPGITVALAANTMYEFEVLAELLSSSGAGLRLGLSFTGAGAATSQYWSGAQTATGANQTVTTAFAPPSQAWAAVATTPLIVMGKGFVHVAAAAGNLGLQQQKITSGTGSVMPGTQLKVRKIV